MAEIKLVVTAERFDKVFDVDSAFYIWECTDKEIYDYMVQFCVGEDGQYLEARQARRLFKQVKRNELHTHMQAFVEAIRDALVPKASGGDSDRQS